MKNMKAALLLIALAVTLAGCGTRQTGDVYNQGEAGREQTVRFATVESVRSVAIAGNRSGVGIVAGGVIGGIGGSEVGHGKGSAVGAVLGGVGGMVAGEAIEESATRKNGQEITVRLDNGELRAIVQQGDEAFKPGERVRLLSSAGVTRVTR
jgi:outer membrane lipoprotein SlyB